ncbi:MAG TPA: FkbM family methyltransferase [Fimbriimonadaceae bacterium]|nr:FkbM family methyltransferase [Fimbriimonadaceae bacterium]
MTRISFQRVKKAALPQGPRRRRLLFGIGRGIELDVDFATQVKLFLGLYEVELNRHLRRLCQPGFNCFDVGAQFGYDALVLAKLGGGRVASFECEPDTYVKLVRNVAYNADLRNRIDLVHGFVGLTTEEQTGKIALDDAAFGGRFFVPDFIKIDIEGGELDALMGARRVLEEHRPNLIVETHSRQLEDDCLAFVRSLGYATTIIDARKVLPDYRPIEHNRWFAASHGAMVRRETHA